jgi:hypothetical protein
MKTITILVEAAVRLARKLSHVTLRLQPSSVARAFLSGALLLSASATAQTPPQRIAMPTFFALASKSPTNSTYQWLRVLSAAQAGVVKIAVAEFDTIGSGVLDGGPCMVNAPAMFDCLRKNNVLVLGYVMTDSARRDLGTAGQVPCPCPRQDQRCALHGGDATGSNAQGTRCTYQLPNNTPDTSVDDWYNTYCPTASNCHIDGIFFDVGPDVVDANELPESTQEPYYQSMFTDVRARPHDQDPSRGSGCGSVPGTAGLNPCVLVNASQFYHDWLMSVGPTPLPAADYAVVWEHAAHGTDTCPKPDNQDYFTNFIPQFTGDCTNPNGLVQCANDWYKADAARLGHVVFSVHLNVDNSIPFSTINNIIATSQSSNGSPAFLYIHDEDCARYSRLPDYFEYLVSALRPSLDIVIPVTDASTGITRWVPLSF